MTDATNEGEFGWGIAGPGQIAEVFAKAVKASGQGRVAAVLGRTPGPAEAFAQRHGGVAVDHIGALVRAPGVEAVYIATPHSAHFEVGQECLDQRRAVLCEKPMTLSVSRTEALVARAQGKRTVLAEGWMYRAHPQMARVVEIVRSGRFGAPKRVESCFGFSVMRRLGRLFDPALGGGAVHDIGGYPLTFALLVAVASGDKAMPQVVEVAGERAETGVDLTSTATLEFRHGLVARLGASIGAAAGMRARVVFEEGELTLEHPFLPENKRLGTRAALRTKDKDGQEERFSVNADTDCFSLEARAVAALVREASSLIEPAWPMVNHLESIRIAQLLDRWHSAALADADQNKGRELSLVEFTPS